MPKERGSESKNKKAQKKKVAPMQRKHIDPSIDRKGNDPHEGPTKTP